MTTVFLSYGRGDDELFVERLCQALKARGLDVWYDRESLSSRGRTFHQEIRDAIAARERLVLVVGPHAVASEYVRQEWLFALEADKVVTPILRVGDYPLVPDELKLLHCEDFRDDARFEFHLDNLARQLSEPPPPLGKLIAVPSLPPHYLARTERLKALRDAVRADLDRPVVLTGETARVGMHGMGGIGKSVLASALVRDRLVRETFPDGIVWVGLGSLPTITELQRRVHRDLGGDGAIATEHEGKTKLKELLADKSVLLVLDDVWRRSDADAFNVLGPRCRALITTRDAGLLTSLGGKHHLVELFTDREALNLLAHAAGVSPDALPSEANEIVAECGRLPLAVALCGGMVQGGTPWRDVLDALREHDLEYIADEHVSEAQHRSLWVAMEVSLHALPEDEQQRFAELAVFSEDTQIPEAAVRTMWSHTGGLSERKARALLIKLKQRSLVQLNRAGDAAARNIGDVSLHDLLRDFAIALVEQRFDGSINQHNQLLAAYLKKCSNGWPSGPNDGYFFKHLRNHFVAAGRVTALADVLHDLRWLEAKNQSELTFDLLFDFRAAIDALPKTDSRWRILKLLDEALRRDVHFIARHSQDYPQALFQCLWNSGWWYDCLAAAAHYDLSKRTSQGLLPWKGRGPKLSNLLESWRSAKEQETSGFVWLRSLCPPVIHLGTAQRAVFRGHGKVVNSVAYFPDGRRLISGSSDHTVRVWDSDNGAELLCISDYIDSVLSVAIYPDGQRLVSGSFDTVGIWDVMSGTALLCLRGHTSKVWSVAISGDGRRIVSGSEDQTVRIWDASSGDELVCLHSVKSRVNSVAISFDGQRVASGSDGGAVQVWDASSGAELHCLRDHVGSVTSVGFSPNGQRLVSGSQDAYSFNDGRVVSEATVRVWDVTTGTELICARGHSSSVMSVSFSPDGRRLVSGSKDQTIRVWDADSGDQLLCLRGHESAVTFVTFSPCGGWLVSGSHDRTIRIWDANSREELLYLQGHKCEVVTVAFSPDGRRLVTGGQQIVQVWDAVGGVELFALKMHDNSVRSVQYSPNGRQIVSSSYNSNLLLWDADIGAELLCLQDVFAKAFSPDGRWLVTGSRDQMVRVWDVASGIELLCLHGHKSFVSSVAISLDGQSLVSGSNDKTVRVWDVVSGAELLCLRGHESAVQSVAYSPDGRHLASWSANSVRIWNASDGSELHCLRDNEPTMAWVSFSSDGQRLFSKHLNNVVQAWDTVSGKIIPGAPQDEVAFGASPSRLPWRALQCGIETVIESTVTGAPISWFPLALEHLTSHPDGRSWGGGIVNFHYFCLFTLEGFASPTI